MEPCMTPRCGRQARSGEPFCKDCRRIVNDDERWALRMAYRSPAYSPTSWDGEAETNLIWVWEGDGAQSVKGAKKAAQFMHWLEWTLVAGAVGRRIERVNLRRRAKERLSRR